MTGTYDGQRHNGRLNDVVEPIHECDVDFPLVDLDGVVRDGVAQLLASTSYPKPRSIIALVRPGLAIFMWAILATIFMELIVIFKGVIVALHWWLSAKSFVAWPLTTAGPLDSARPERALGWRLTKLDG